MTNLTRRALPQAQLPAAFALLTTCFSAGQSIGPVLAGAMSQGPAGTRTGLLLSVVLLAVGTVVCLAQREIAAAQRTAFDSSSGLGRS